MIDTVSFDSLVPGPRLLFLGGVHGDENPGMLALSKILADLQAGKIRLLRGKVTIAARVNAGAAKRGLHFLEENLNRLVKRHDAPATHEQILANELVALIDASDAVLDLHGTPAPTRPFVFLDDESPENRSWAVALGTDYLLCGWPALYKGGVTVTTTEYAQSRGKRALTVEVGQNDDAVSELRLTTVVRRERKGFFARPWKNFDPINEGEVLASCSDGVDLVAPNDGFMIMPFEGASIGEEWYYIAVKE